MYGCGDFITDYEGISGYEQFRSDLALMYLVDLEPRQGRLLEVRLVPMQARRFRLNRVSKSDAQWLCSLLKDLGESFGAKVQLASDNSMALALLILCLMQPLI